MRVPGLVLMLSAIALGEASAGEATVLSQQLAQPGSPGCMPIGVTAAGELVFPWECREAIEREHGAMSVGVPMPPKMSVSNQPASSGPHVRITRNRPVARSAAPQHVATIPNASAAPPAATPALDRRSQVKPPVVGRRQPEARGAHAPVQPSVPQPRREIRFAPPG